MIEDIDIDIYMDHVVVAGQHIKRPSRVTRSAWLFFWEGVASKRRRRW